MWKRERFQKIQSVLASATQEWEHEFIVGGKAAEIHPNKTNTPNFARSLTSSTRTPCTLSAKAISQQYNLIILMPLNISFMSLTRRSLCFNIPFLREARYVKVRARTGITAINVTSANHTEAPISCPIKYKQSTIIIGFAWSQRYLKHEMSVVNQHEK